MTDLVERLREIYATHPMVMEAAAEIERLRAELADWKQAAGVEAGLRREFLARAEKAEAEIERLHSIIKIKDTDIQQMSEERDRDHAEIERLSAEVEQLMCAGEHEGEEDEEIDDYIESLSDENERKNAIIMQHETEIERHKTESEQRWITIVKLQHDSDQREAEIERLKRNQITGRYTVIAQAAAMQAQRADIAERKMEEAISKGNEMVSAINSALALQDAMLSEINNLRFGSGHPPPLQIFAAKNNFDTAMKKLLGDQP